MCDYSLMSVPNRLAKEGEELIVHTFPVGTKGLAALSDLQCELVQLPSQRKSFRSFLGKLGSFLREIVAEPCGRKSVTAVCVPPGARLLLRDISDRMQREAGVRRVEEVTFTQITASSFTHRDAVRFRNGLEMLLQQLQEGQRVRVLGLSWADTGTPELELLAPTA